MKPTIKAIVFDVYGTLFDVHSVKDACEEEFPEKEQPLAKYGGRNNSSISFGAT